MDNQPPTPQSQEPFQLPQPVNPLANGHTPVSPDAAPQASLPATTPPAASPAASSQPQSQSATQAPQADVTYVQRVQQLRTQYESDPFTYSRELYTLRAEYMQQQLGQQLKMPPEGSAG